MQLGTFSGRLRYYPNWKNEFNKYVLPIVGKSSLYLSAALEKDSEPYKLVEGLDDFDKMFKRLDETFGNSRRVIDVVVEDIRAIVPIPEGDSVGFIKMVNKIEQCFLNLDQLGLASELNTANITSQIGKLLPPTQKQEWVKLVRG